MTLRVLTAVIAIVTILTLAGCNGGGGDSSGGVRSQARPRIELVATSGAIISDLPIPVGFSLDEGRSRNFAAAGARYVDHFYKGRGEKFAVGRFYKRHMPNARWVLVTDMFVQGEIVLDFEKETERCRIVVVDGNLFNKSYIKVQLWTTGKIVSPGAKRSK